MQKNIFVAILLICSVFASTQDFSKKNDALLSKKLKASEPAYSPSLNIVLGMEKPTPYQRKQIESLFFSIVKESRNKKFDNYLHLLRFINSKIKGEDKDSIFLKDAFAYQPGKKPEGAFDCDSRSIMALSVVEALNFPFGNLYLLETTGHVVLFDGKTVYDLRNNSQYELTNEDRLLVNVFSSGKELKSLLLSNIATYLGGGSDLSFRKKGKENFKKQSRVLFEQALDLNPKNITALQNLNIITGDLKYKMQLLGVIFANYKDVFAKPAILKVNTEVKTKNNARPQKESLAIEAIANSDVISNAVENMIFEAFAKKQFDVAVFLEDMLVKAGKNDSFSDGYAAQASFYLGNYDDVNKYFMMSQEDQSVSLYKKRANKEEKMLSEGEKEMQEIFSASKLSNYSSLLYNRLYEYLNEMNMVAGIMSGRIVLTSENIEYYSMLSYVVRDIRTGNYPSTPYLDVYDAIRTWPGCRNFIRGLKGIIKTDESICK